MMAGLATAAQYAVVDRLLKGYLPLTGRSKVVEALIGVTAALLVLGLGFMIYAAHLWVSRTYTPEMAALVTGGLLLALAALCVAGMYLLVQYTRRRVIRVKDDITQSLTEIMGIAGDELAEPVRDNPKTAVLIASIAGFLAGERFL
ncbi:MAG TPA: hypothetical protein PKX87_05785 [Alphaproteobacteria bacterium]|mgnify:CR=1 FL=1|nr:hypothetical protein [Alphaproteobacteria bacterium]